MSEAATARSSSNNCEYGCQGRKHISLQEKWNNDRYNAHRRKLNEVRATVDTRPPQTYIHLHLNMKKLQAEEERYATIDKENRKLLEKMSTIMRTKGAIDNQNNYQPKSSSTSRRQKEQEKIAKENQQILKRITESKPKYDHTEWERDYEKHLEHLDRHSAYAVYQPQRPAKSRTGQKVTQKNDEGPKSSKMENNEEKNSTQREDE